MYDDNISYGVTLSLVLDTETPRAQHALLSLQPCGNYTTSAITRRRSPLVLLGSALPDTREDHFTLTVYRRQDICMGSCFVCLMRKERSYSCRTKVGGVVRLSSTGNLIPGCGRAGIIRHNNYY